MKALVIGGNRFFGKRLVKLLLDRRHEVTILNRGRLTDDFGDKVRRIVLDRRTLAKDLPALGDGSWDIVFDQVCYDATDAKGACAAFQGRTRRYVMTSSQSVYGRGFSLAESAFDPQSYSFSTIVESDKDYAEAKRQAESVLFKEAAFPVTAARFPVVMGEDDYKGRLKLHVDLIKRGKPIYFPNVEARISLINSPDAAAFLYSLVDKSHPEPVNCCAPKPVTLKSIISLIEKAARRTARIVTDPGQGEASPYGIESDWTMDTGRLSHYAFVPAEADRWLPGLISTLAR